MAELPRTPTREGCALEVARNAVLLLTTALRHLTDDPLAFVVQVARRFPSRWRPRAAQFVRMGARRRPGVRRVLAEFIADRPADAAALIERCAEPKTHIGRRLLAELSVAVGGRVPPDAAASTRARAAWNAGDVTGAVRAVESSRSSRRYAARLSSERETMLPGFRLRPARRPAISPGSGPTVLHLLTNSVPHTQSGYAIRSHEILKAQRGTGIDASAVTRIGYPVTVGLPLARATETVDGVRYHRLLPARLASTPGSRLQQMVKETLPLALHQHPGVLHTTTNFTNALVTEALARSLEVPWVYEVRGLLEETWLASRHPSIRAEAAASERYALLRAKETELMLAADHVVVLSEVSRRQLIDRGIPDDRITTVPNAIDEDLLDLQLDPDEARARLGLPRDGFWLGSVSSLVDYEGFHTLLRAAALLRNEGRDVRVALAGNGVSRPALMRLAEELGVAAHVAFPGAVPREDAWLWHRALDVFTVPRRDLTVCREVTPLKPVEAMAAGRPIIASDLPALRELIRDPESGVLVKPDEPKHLAEAARSLMDSRELRGRYGDAGRSYAAGRTWQHNAEIYRKVYQDVGAMA